MIINRWHTRRVVYQAAMRIACRDINDEEAKDALKKEIIGSESGVRGALRALSASRYGFQGDRAYRLLDAVRSNRAVARVAADMVDLFEGEQHLGRMPIKDAFLYLAELEPKLNEIGEAGDPSRSGVPKAIVSEKPSQQVISAIVGPSAGSADRLIQSEIALSIVGQYLAILAGESQFGSFDTSYFEGPRRMVIKAGRW